MSIMEKMTKIINDGDVAAGEQMTSATRRASGIDGGDAGDDEDAREGRGAGR